MRTWPGMRAVTRRIPRWLLLAVGLWALVGSAISAMGGYSKVWAFERMPESRYTAMAILTGTLRLRSGLSRLDNDEQVFNGAGYTNWGFGVPSLEVPFHAAAAHLEAFPQKFFPDRCIFFIYLALAIPIVWAAFDRLLAMRETIGASRIRRHVLSWAATMLTLVVCLFPLMSARFIIYEETISYFLVFELLAISAYVFALPKWGRVAVAMIAAASGVALLVRPTGLFYLGMWGALVGFESGVRDARQRWRAVGTFAAVAAPFVAFWMFTNWVRAGSVFALGLRNSNPGYPWHLAVLRFGSRCGDTPHHVLEEAVRLFRGFFFTTSDMPRGAWPADGWMGRCHFDWELRPPDSASYAREPFFGVVVLALLAWTFLSHLLRPRRSLSAYLPFATFAALFAGYVYAGAGFAWRYDGDFWPAVLLACVQYVHALPTPANRLLGWRLAAVFGVASYALFIRDIEPARSTLETIQQDDLATRAAWNSMWADFSNSRYSRDPALPSSAKCGQRFTWPYHNGEGWDSGWGRGCGVDVATNVYLGVPDKGDDRYTLHFETKGVSAPTLRVYVNGRYYTAYKSGDGYTATVFVHYASLTSPIVMTSIEWTHGLDPVPGEELLSIDLS